jgi:ribosomal protein S2
LEHGTKSNWKIKILEQQEADGVLKSYQKSTVLNVKKLTNYAAFNGIKDMKNLPDVVVLQVS